MNPDYLVPRETLGRMREFQKLAAHWNRRINLFSQGTVKDLWQRHILDSAQIFALAPKEARSWVDLGSGGGFPGIVCAIIAASRSDPIAFTLIEADGRKAAFLREAARQLDLDIRISDTRIEASMLPPQDVVTARALAPLDRLLTYACRFTHPGTRLLFPKGETGDSELTFARRTWHIRVVRIPSLTNPKGMILAISEVRQRS